MTFAIVGGGQLDTGYTIDNSLRFNDGDGPDLSRTNVASPTNSKKYTYSVWIKRGAFSDGDNRQILSAINGNDRTQILFRSGSNEAIRVLSTDDAFSTFKYLITTDALYRDASAWYHVVFVFDSTNATANDRFKIYVNGVEQSLSISTSVASNYDDPINSGSVAQDLGSANGSEFFDGYFAEAHFIDGTAKSPTDFGEFDADSGIWKPIEYTGTYGTNGFYLDFENSGSLGADQSGNGNNFTPTNFTATDQTQDTPTNNFCTLNPLAKAGIAGIPYDGNLSHVGQTSGYEQTVLGTIVIPAGTGKWYWESKTTGAGSTSGVGVVATEVIDGTDYTGTYTTSSTPLAPFSYNYGWGVQTSNGNKKHDGTNSSYSTGDLNQVRQVAIDCENGKIYFGVNNVWGNSGDPAAGTNPAYTDTDLSTKNIIPWSAVSDTDGRYRHMNFGNPNAGFNETTNQSDENGFGKFKYAPPSGFLALCTQNLATELSPTIDDGSEYFNTLTWTGNGSNPRSFTGVGFQPDWTWQKVRSTAASHMLYDSSRGVGERLHSDQSVAEATETAEGTITSFDSDGFTLDAGTSNDFYVNDSGVTYVAWNWKANGGTTSSNTDGTITSTVQANPTAGFSIVLYSGNQTDGATVGHGLGIAPQVVIVKERNGTSGWIVKHPGLTDPGYYLILNDSDAQSTVANVWSDTDPSSTVFTLGDNTSVNENTLNYVAYCFAEIEGYSKFGRYTGNGSTNGPFVYTGFRPAFVLWKRTDSTTDWRILDTTRDSFNVADKRLFPNTSGAENTTQDTLDFLSNGFKHRATNSGGNASGGSYVYMCFAKNPFVSSTAVAGCAR